MGSDGYKQDTFRGDNQVPLGTADLPCIAGGWWVSGVRNDEHQSWERPFTVVLAANDRPDFQGRMMFVDTGEAFSYFETKTLSMPAVPGMPMSQMPSMRMPVPHTGRPEQRFPGVSKYLDRQALAWLGTDGDGNRRRLWSLGEELVGETETQVRQREETDAKRFRLDLAPMNGQACNYVVNKVLNRTVMKSYRFEAIPSGEPWMMFYGAQFTGHDMYRFAISTGVTALPGDGHPFGEGTLGKADFYDAEWMVTRRFGGICPMSDDTDRFKEWVLRMSGTAKLDDAVLREMADRERAFREASNERHRKDMAGLRQLSQEMHEDNRRRQQVSEWEDAQRRQRKIDSDRRIREGWSAVIRGVEQYRGPYGELIEIPISGPNMRAYYDGWSGTVLHTDGRPYGWDELPRWQW